MSTYPQVPQQISDPISENLTKLRELFPSAVKDGALDMEALRAELGDFEEIRPGDETYELGWVGKKAAKKEAFIPLLGKTLAFKDDGKHPDTSQNIYVEGDNLEALKLLRQNYFGEVKMMYIDPPYNTGKDFVYTDKFTVKSGESEEEEGAVSAEGQRLIKNEKSSNRFHARWLDMMFPRLRLAKDLLRQDGVIFISIDDNEVANLKALCDEVFGSDNFIAQFVWNTEGHTDNQFDVKVSHEYVLLYTKNNRVTRLGSVVDPNTRKESNLWSGFAENSITKNGPGNPPSEITLPVGFPCKSSKLALKSSSPPTGFFDQAKSIGFITRDLTEEFSVSYPIRLNSMIVESEKLTKECRVFSGWANANKLKAFINNGCNPIDDGDDKMHFYLSERGVIYYRREREKARNILSVLRNMGTTERMRSELEEMQIYFQYPKPKELLSYLIQIGMGQNGLLLDFFSGSGSAAHALLKLNSEDGGVRNFIMVQYPEQCSENTGSSKNKFKTIAEIGKERIRRAGEKIKGELKAKHTEWKKQHAIEAKKSGKLAFNEGGEAAEEANPYVLNPDSLDIGFKSFRIEDTKINWLKKDLRGEDIIAEAGLTTQDALDFVPGFTDTDVVYELMLRQSNIPLTGAITLPAGTGKRTYLYADAYLICLEKKITKDLVEALAAIEPTPNKYFFRDSAFGKDIALKDETFRRLKAEIHKHHGDLGTAYTVEFI